MSEIYTDGTELIPASQSFEQAMSSVVRRGQASSWHEAEEVLITKDLQFQELDPRDYIFLASQNLGKAFSDPVPGVEKEIVAPESQLAAISEALDKGHVVTIAGFQRQGKTSLAQAVAYNRQQQFVHADAQTYLLSNLETNRPMAISPHARDDEIKGLISSHVTQADHPKVWQALNEYAVSHNKRLLVIFDELAVFRSEAADKRDVIKEEIEEVASLCNLDLIVIEHIYQGRRTGDLIDILPANIARFLVIGATGPETFDFLRSETCGVHLTFLPEAADEIRNLGGGWLSLSAKIGQNIIKHSNGKSKKPRFIFGIDDVEDWVSQYIESPKRRVDDLFKTVVNILDQLDPAERSAIYTTAESTQGADIVSLGLDEDSMSLQTGLINLDKKAGKAYITSSLLQKLLPQIKQSLEIKELRRS
jgi:hypothetical protein